MGHTGRSRCRREGGEGTSVQDHAYRASAVPQEKVGDYNICRDYNNCSPLAQR